MKKLCHYCQKIIKGKPIIYDNYYFCSNNRKISDKRTCLSRYLGEELKGRLI